MRSEFDELKRFAIADVLSVSGKEKTTSTIEKHIDNIIDVAIAREQNQQSKVDELQKGLDAVNGLAQTLWEKSEEKHQQGKVWESKTLGECADEILDVLEQALKGGSNE